MKPTSVNAVESIVLLALTKPHASNVLIQIISLLDLYAFPEIVEIAPNASIKFARSVLMGSICTKVSVMKDARILCMDKMELVSDVWTTAYNALMLLTVMSVRAAITFQTTNALMKDFYSLEF